VGHLSPRAACAVCGCTRWKTNVPSKEQREQLGFVQHCEYGVLPESQRSDCVGCFRSRGRFMNCWQAQRRNHSAGILGRVCGWVSPAKQWDFTCDHPHVAIRSEPEAAFRLMNSDGRFLASALFCWTPIEMLYSKLSTSSDFISDFSPSMRA
jgi:hypothetical protein